MLEDNDTKDIAEEYYFSYFKLVQGAFDKITSLWKAGRGFPLKSRRSIYDTSIPIRSLSADQLVDGDLNNILIKRGKSFEKTLSRDNSKGKQGIFDILMMKKIRL